MSGLAPDLTAFAAAIAAAEPAGGSVPFTPPAGDTEHVNRANAIEAFPKDALPPRVCPHRAGSRSTGTNRLIVG